MKEENEPNDQEEPDRSADSPENVYEETSKKLERFLNESGCDYADSNHS